MAYATGSRHFHRKSALSSEKKPSVPSLVVHINQSGIVTTPINGSTYRTEVYLQQRENKLSTGTKTTWKNLMQQKRIFDHDQAEIDRVVSTIDSIHGTFNRSLLVPYNQVYSSLYGDDDHSDRLMKTFCQRQDHYIKDEEKNHTQETSSSFGNFQNTDSDSINSEDEEEEKKKSYDSGYGSVMPRGHLSRELLVDVSQNSHPTTDSLL
jgi:cell division septum initiation protein DivIVA